jgi:DNA processing protein
VSDSKYWLGFSLVPEIGPRRVDRLLKWFGDIRDAWHAAESDLRRAGLEPQPTANLVKKRLSLDLDTEVARVTRTGARLVAYADPGYPEALKHLPDPPLVLYVRGALLPQDEQSLAVVGTRKASAYGRDAAYSLSRQLARHGITIISGLAVGIDTAAHRGALDGGGRTIAILGCGIDQVYPRENGPLAAEIARCGALVSEFPLGTPPDSRNFPRRNRVISGMSLGVLVAEAPEHSGALITAEMAAEQGHDVFAIPGNIFNMSSRGTNRLIQDGAKLVLDVDDILDELQIARANLEVKRSTEDAVPTDDTERQILAQLNADPIHVDDLARLCNMPIALITSSLTILELKGLAQKVGPMQYCLIPYR